MLNNVDQNKLNLELSQQSLKYKLVILDPVQFKQTTIVKWVVCTDTDTKKRIKVYNKHACFRYNGRPEVYNAEEIPGETKFDTEKYLLPILRDEVYDYLPKIVFETDTYLGVEWFSDDWRAITWKDLITQVGKLSLPTALFRKIGKEITNLQLQSSNAVDYTEEEYNQWYEYCTDEGIFRCLFDADVPGEHCSLEHAKELISNNTFKPGLMLSDIAADDFIINKVTNQWKLVDIDNFVFLWSPNMNYIVNPLRDQGHLSIVPPAKLHNHQTINYYLDGIWKEFNI